MKSMSNKGLYTEQQMKEIAYASFKAAQNAYTMYPDNKHTFADHAGYLWSIFLKEPANNRERDIAEKAWDAAVHCVHYPLRTDKSTYLNANYPK